MNINLSDSLGQNLIINPSMDIAQRGTSFTGITTLTYTLDRWWVNHSGPYSFGVDRVADVPSWSQSTYSLKVTNQTASTASTTAFGHLSQSIEGYNIRRLRSKKSVLSFSVKASKAGIYTAFFVNELQDVRMTKAFTIHNANTWEKKVIKLPIINEALGTGFKFDNSIGLQVHFALISGSTYIAANEDWSVQTSVGAPTHNVDFGDTVGNTFQVTDVALHEGIEEIPFEKMVRDYPKELQLCYRYYFSMSKNVDTVGSPYNNFSTKQFAHHIVRKFPVTMRVTPSVSFTLFVSGSTNVTGFYYSFETNDNYFHIRNGAGSGSYAAAGDLYLSANADAEL